MVQVTAEEAKARLQDLIVDAMNGETVVITQDGLQVVQLVPINNAQRRPQYGSAKGLLTMADDFDAPLEDFEEYMP